MGSREERERLLGIPFWQHENGYWYADFRSYESGKRESLGTRNREDAEQELADRKAELEEYGEKMEAREGDNWLLEDFAQEHLDRKDNEVAESTWENYERALGYLLTYLRRQLPREPRLSDVTARRLSDHLQDRLRSVKASTLGVELSAISSMLQRAHDWNLVRRNEARHVTAPTPETSEPDFLETGEAAKVLKVAKGMVEDSESRCRPHLHALLATFLLTGGRRNEVFGLERRDANLKAGTVRFRPNDHRGLKNEHSRRSVPLWPQLRTVLAPYMEAREDDYPLLFPAWEGGLVTNIRSALDTVETKAKLDTRLTPKVFRHTYTATRIQTLDHGEPVSLYTVARELGHRSLDRLEDTYGHLQQRRSRLSEVRYQEADVVALEDKRKA